MHLKRCIALCIMLLSNEADDKQLYSIEKRGVYIWING